MKNGIKIAGLGVRTLEDVNLSLGPGQCVGLTGPSGSGKTLLLRAVADLDPHRGEVWLGGASAKDTAPPAWRRQVALLPAETAWWHDTVGPHLASVDLQWLEALGFDRDVLSWRISRLSSGERQRLGVARLLLNEPDVLLLDEPTANLDAGNAQRVEALLSQYRRKRRAMVIWVSHDIQQLRRNCQAIYAIGDGRLVLQPARSPRAGETP